MRKNIQEKVGSAILRETVSLSLHPSVSGYHSKEIHGGGRDEREQQTKCRWPGSVRSEIHKT